MREDDIRDAVKNMPGELFERFSRELLRRELYPGLNPTSASHDLGEDARTEITTVFLHDGKWISLFASKTALWRKLEQDCKRCKQTRRRINTVVFVTAGDPRTTTQEDWRRRVRKEFRWGLVVHTLSYLAPVASAPQHDRLVDDYLGIPPPGEDFIQTIEAQFAYHTDRTMHQIRLSIPGISGSLQRDEVERIEAQLLQGKQVMLTGDAGTGKSGIAAYLVQRARNANRVVLFLDARHIGHTHSEMEFRQHLGLRGPVANAIARAGRYKGCSLIIDQLDNTIGTSSSRLLIDLAASCHSLESVEVVVISRKRESHEVQLLKKLADEGFVELTSFELDDSRVIELLGQLGISQLSSSLVELGRNLLNLELVGMVKHQKPDFDFAMLLEEVDLWEQYRQIWLEREAVISNTGDAEQMLAEAIRLARIGLNSEDRGFTFDYPASRQQQRLVSWNIIINIEGRLHRFSHEKLQDFLYAWDATQRGLMPSTVMTEIKPYRTRNILDWMAEIYTRADSQLFEPFLREALDVQ